MYFKDYIDSVNEGIIKTYPGDKVLKDILSSLEKLHINSTGSFEDNKIKLTINKRYSDQFCFNKTIRKTSKSSI